MLDVGVHWCFRVVGVGWIVRETNKNYAAINLLPVEESFFMQCMYCRKNILTLVFRGVLERSRVLAV